MRFITKPMEDTWESVKEYDRTDHYHPNKEI